jgi:antitoxin PrlF
MPVATMTSKGQITMPKTVRDQLKLQPGDRVEFMVGEDGTVTVWPVTAHVTTLKGLVPKPKRAVTLKEMQDAIERRGGSL